MTICMSDLEYLADKVIIHRWPQDTPEWDDSTKKQLESITKKSEKKRVQLSNIIKIENFEFSSIKKIGITVPFFKEECTMIFETKFGEFFAHIHITIKSKEYVEIFNKLHSWKDEFFPN